MKRKVLIVDDSTLIIEMLKDTLVDAGYEVNAAENGQDALNLVGEKEYDLMMTDINMPKMDGMELISEVRKIPGRRFLPIVVISTEERDERFRECTIAGASGYLQKPIEKEQVLEILNNFIPY